MAIQEIMKLCTSGSAEENMAILLAFHCAPILKGSKAANIMTVSREEFKGIGRLLQDTSISYRFLNTKGDKAILYLYREKELKQYLETEEVKEFLQEYGYWEESIQSMLNRLSKRIGLYGDGTMQFPHEIGAFLGYPVMDMKGFIEHNGKNFVYSGYWKVYHDVQGAVKLFQRYDEERRQTIKEVILGKSIREIAV